MRTLQALAVLLMAMGGIAHAQSTIELLDPGAQPRALLRYQFTAGQTGRAEYVLGMQGTMSVDGHAVSMPAVPDTRVVMTLRVTEVAADGYAHIVFDSTSAEALIGQEGSPPADRQMTQALAASSRLSGSWWSDARGRARGGDVALRDGPAGQDADAPLVDMALQMTREASADGSAFDTAMLPEEPVGEGARWRVTRQQRIGPIEQVLVQEYTLLSREGQRVRLGMQGTTSQRLGGGMQADSTATASAEVLIDLRALVPTMTMEVKSTTTTPAAGGAQGQAGEIRAAMTMRHRVAPVSE